MFHVENITACFVGLGGPGCFVCKGFVMLLIKNALFVNLLVFAPVLQGVLF